MKKLILLILLAFVAASAFVGWEAFRFLKKPIASQPGEFILDVAPGATLVSVSEQLKVQGAQYSNFILKAWTRVENSGSKLRIGEYKISKSWSPYRALKEILSGKPLLYKITIKEGFNAWDIMNAFEQAGFQLTDAQKKRLVTFEGYWFPETYSYQKYDSSEKILKTIRDEFDRRALPILKQHPWADTEAGLHKLLTLASIVEKESGVFEEQPIISSVFWNRLSKKMKLQSDPTTIYGLLPNFDGNIKRVHLTTPTPYNTYTLPGLPVGPISNPGESALKATVKPQETEFFYFVSKGDGTHVFSKTYAEHNNYVKQYQLKLKVNKQSQGKKN